MRRLRTAPASSPLVAFTLLGLVAVACQVSPPPPAMQVPLRAERAAAPLRVDVEHYALDLVLDPIARAIQGTCTVRFTAGVEELAAVPLHLEGLEVYQVLDSQGRDLGHFTEGGVLTAVLVDAVAPGEVEELTVYYGGRPKKGLWFVRPRDGAATQVFTQGECEDARWWFPCVDVPADRATSELRVTLPAGWTSVAAGERVDRSETSDSVVEHWRMSSPHPAYLMTLVAGDLAVVEDEWDGVPLSYLAAPEHASELQATFGETPEVLAFLSDVTGLRYPYPKYSQACVEGFPFGGMENISATTVTATTVTDSVGRRDGDSVGLIAHEAAHQWFGDLLTCATWDHVWLNEGFATYMTQLYFEHSRGDEDFRDRWYDGLQGYLAADVGQSRRPTVYGVYRDPIDLFFSGQVYGGAAARLHYLRFVLGDEAFFDGVATYVAENQGRGVTTEDFQLAMEKTSGVALDGFFDQWFYAAGYPELAVSWSWDAARGVVVLAVEQGQRADGGTPGSFRLPVDVEVRTAKGEVLHRLELTQRRQRFELASDEQPRWVWLDEGGWLPARIDRNKAVREWMAIAAGQDDVVARRVAVETLGGVLAGDASDVTPFVRAEVINRLRQDSSAHVRAAAAAALGRDGSPEARLRLMAAASSDLEPSVRVAALGALEGWGADVELASFARAQYEAAVSWNTMGAAAGLVATADPEGAFSWIVRHLFEAESPHDVLRARLLDVLAETDNTRVLSQLVQWATDATVGSQAREAAVRGLGRLGANDRDARTALVQLLREPNIRVRSAAVSALSGYPDNVSRKALQAHYSQTVFPREKRAIEAAFGR